MAVTMRMILISTLGLMSKWSRKNLNPPRRKKQAGSKKIKLRDVPKAPSQDRVQGR